MVCAASREVLQWFASQPVPAFALFGRRAGLPIAGTGPDKPSALAAATHALVELGHRRIVLLCRRPLRLPEPGAFTRAFLDALKASDIPASDYNLPDWEESSAGFHLCLDALFRFTPPTALIIDETSFFIAAQQFLARRKIRVPEEVSLIACDADIAFAHCVPTVAHMSWDPRPVMHRIVRWVASTSHGKPDHRQTLTPSDFIPGGTLGPAADRGPSTWKTTRETKA